MFNTLTLIDTTTTLVQTTRVDNKTCSHVTNKLRQYWLSRYPHPQRIVHNGGGQFTGHQFKDMCQAFGGLKVFKSTAKPTKFNAICERMHQTIGNVLRVYFTVTMLKT